MANMNETPTAQRLHIGFFGCRNAGKSSLVNAFTGQNLAVVSEVKGTTTDPVSKAMELLPIGPVQVIDTPGLDDGGTLGKLRVEKTMEVLRRTDLAILAVDAEQAFNETDQVLLDAFRQRSIPYIIARTKADLLSELPETEGNTVYVSAKTGLHIERLKEMAAALGAKHTQERPLVRDLLQPGDVAVLVVPIDKAAPKGRLILPQQQTIRDALEAGASCLVCRDTELTQTLAKLSQPPKMVITDSQVFGKVSKLVPEDILLTSFSILMARYKGDLRQAVEGAAVIDTLMPGDRVLIAEGCTHHRQCEDIGTVKLPRWLRQRAGEQVYFDFASGNGFPEDLSVYRLVVHCGGCTLPEKEMVYRLNSCRAQGIPVTNYGIAIAHCTGILKRTVQPFPQIFQLL